MIKDANYITIQGWMKNKLHLNGNELLTFAIVYGFIQDGKKFTGSRQYIADWIGISVRWVQTILNGLVEKNLLQRETINNTYTSYSLGKKALKIIDGGCEDTSQGCELSSQGCEDTSQGCEDSSHNNTIYNSINKTINTYSPPFTDSEFNMFIKSMGYDKILASKELLSQIKRAKYKKKNGENLTIDTWKSYITYWVKKTLKDERELKNITDDGEFDRQALKKMRERRLKSLQK